MNINGISNITPYTSMRVKQTALENDTVKYSETAISVKNRIVDTVEIVGISDAEKMELERRAAVDKVTPKEVLAAALASAPNNEDVERSKALSEKFIPIQNKMLAGKPLTPAEKNFMQKNYPEWSAIAQRVEQEVQQLREQIKKSGSSEEANKIIMEKKMQLMNSGKTDGFTVFMVPAIDDVFRMI